MSNFYADPSGAGGQYDYRYANISGLPFKGEPGLMKPQEYRAQTATTVAVGYGNYDTAMPEQRYFGRTLHEVLSRIVAGEFRCLLHQEQWICCEKFGVRILYFVQWVEYSDRLKHDAVQATSMQLTNIPNSR